ncbi:alpha/beta fold hydrolase [Streptomyces thermolineatus]|uniref:Alpha/beta fold hydrolase n=1 Tax=Streptomyces thermolineatus TaxID=44033 RepID=A0ABN3LS00_9ACTN
MSETPPNTLQYRFDGPEDAPVLILGPALGTTWHMWDRQIPELSRQWRVVRYDLPGHAGTPTEAFGSIDDLADRVLALLDSLGIERFAYAGVSLGGAVGTALALRAPHRLGSLALVCASPRFGTPDEWRHRAVVVRSTGLEQTAATSPETWFTPHFRATQPAIVEWAVQMVRVTDAQCYIAACEALAGHDVRADLGRIGVPTLVVGGAEDTAAPPADARALVAGIPDSRLAVVPGAAHLANIEQPAAVTDLLVTHFSATWSEPRAAAAVTFPTPPPVPPQPHAAPAAAGTGTGEVPDVEATALVPAPVPAPDDRLTEGTRVRREVLGDAHVDRALAAADDFTGDFQDYVTRAAWGEVWTRPGLDRRMRSVATLTALTARGHYDDIAHHTRAALRNGLTPDEIKEVLLHAAVYCGVPAAGAAFAVAGRTIREELGPRRE